MMYHLNPLKRMKALTLISSLLTAVASGIIFTTTLVYSMQHYFNYA